MKSIHVVDFLENPVLLAGELGDRLEEKIKQTLNGGHGVEVDFAGYKFISSTFFNRAFGQLCLDMDWSADKFKKNVKVAKLEEDDYDDVELALNNAQLRRKLKKSGVTDMKEYFESRLPA